MHPIQSSTDLPSSFERPHGRTAERGSGMQGHLGAEQFEMDLEASVLGDAAEEASLFHAERAESKQVAERRREVTRPRSLMSPEAIETYLDETEDEGEGESKLLVFVQRILGGKGDPAEQAKALFGSPTAQYLALQYALQRGSREGDAEHTDAILLDCLEDLELEHGPRIRADINVLSVAKEGADGPAEVRHFQSTYADIVLDTDNLLGIEQSVDLEQMTAKGTLASPVKYLLGRFGVDGLIHGAERLQKALGRDLSAARSSVSPVRLQLLVGSLFKLSTLCTVFEEFADLMRQLKAGGKIESTAKPTALVKDLIDLSSEEWVSPERFQGLFNNTGANDNDSRIQFLTGLKALLRNMPPQIFFDPERRFMALDAAQLALDAAIDQEEF